MASIDERFYETKDIVVFPSSNSQDEGKLTIEENMRELVTRISKKNFIISGFDVTKNGNDLEVSEGVANFQGYNISTIASKFIKPPNSMLDNILVMKLAKDGSDHVVGDVTDYGRTTFNGVYIEYCDEEYAKLHYSDILILAYLGLRESDIGIVIDEIIREPLSDNRLDAEDVELDVNGAASHTLDATLDNYKFYRMDSEGELVMYNPVQTPSKLIIDYTTKPPTVTTDLQRYVDNMVKSYVSKYGDEVYGGISFKVSLEGNQGIIVSPRRPTRLSLRDDTRNVSFYDSPIESSGDPESADMYYGGTLRSIVPESFTGVEALSVVRDRDPAIYAELVSAKNELTGMKIRAKSNNSDDPILSYTHVGNPAGNNTEFKIYNEVESDDRFQAFIRMDRGKIWIDSRRTGYDGLSIPALDYNPEYDPDIPDFDQDGAIVIHTAEDISKTNIKTVFRNNNVIIEEGEGTRIYHDIGVRRYHGTTDPTDQSSPESEYNYPYFEMSSDNDPTFLLKSMAGQNFMYALDPNSPYISIRPYIFTERVTAVQEIQLGTDRSIDGKDLDNHPDSAPDNNIIMTTDWTKNVLGNGVSSTSSLVHRVNGLRQDQISQYYGMFSSKYVGVSTGATKTYNGAVRYDSRSTDDQDNPYKSSDHYVQIHPRGITINHGNNNINESTWIRFTTQNETSDSSSIAPTAANYQANTKLAEHGVSIEHKASENILYVHGNLNVVGEINSINLGTKYLTTAAAAMGSAKFGRVYNAIYNDLAELMEKQEPTEPIEPGDVICVTDSGKYTRCCIEGDHRVIGVCSDTYGYLLGGDDVDPEENLKKYIPVGISGRVWVKCDSDVIPGDLLVSSNKLGYATKMTTNMSGTSSRGTVIGKALSTLTNGKVYMMIMLR